MKKAPLITEAIVERTRAWLKKDGITFFSDIKKKHGTLNACWMEGDIPHPVHFREGMQVRNFLRGTCLCDSWDCNDFDNNWMTVIEQAIAGD
jgi:hypothetical protein